jgi:hypothetical protein
MRYFNSIFLLSIICAVTLPSCAGHIKSKTDPVQISEIPVSIKSNIAQQQNSTLNNPQKMPAAAAEHNSAGILPINLPGMGDLKSVQKQPAAPVRTKAADMKKTMAHKAFPIPEVPPVSTDGIKYICTSVTPAPLTCCSASLFLDEFDITVAPAKVKAVAVNAGREPRAVNGLSAEVLKLPVEPSFKSLPSLPLQDGSPAATGPAKKPASSGPAEVKTLALAQEIPDTLMEVKLPSLEEIGRPAVKQADNSAVVEKPPEKNIEEAAAKQDAAAPQMPETPQQVNPRQQPAVPEPGEEESATAAAPEQKQVLPAAPAEATAAHAAEPQENAAVNAVTASTGDDEPDERLSNIRASSVKKAEQNNQPENIATAAPAPQAAPAAPKEPVKAAFKENISLKHGKPPQKAKSLEKKGASKMHTVERGDNLQSLAQKYYNDKSMWLMIYEANKDKIEKGSLETGQVILIP